MGHVTSQDRRSLIVTVIGTGVLLFVLRDAVLTAVEQPVWAATAGLVGLAGLAVVFAGVMVRMVWRRADRPAAATIGAVLAAQVLGVALAAVGVGQDGLVGVLFVCVTAIVLLPRGAAGWIVAGCAAAAAGLPRVVPGWQPADADAVPVAAAGLVAYSMVAGAERRLRLAREAEEAEVLATFRERERITQDMHDVLGHTLTVISVKAELAARLHHATTDGGRDVVGPDGARVDRVAAELADVQSLARTALADVRGLIAHERRPTLPDELAAARSAFDAAGITADLPGAADHVPPDRAELFAWVLREGCTNVLRHSRARSVRVGITPDTLVIEDDAAARDDVGGTSPTGNGSPGHGLTGLATRARAAGAVLESGPRPGGGFRLTATYRPVTDDVTHDPEDPA